MSFRMFTLVGAGLAAVFLLAASAAGAAPTGAGETKGAGSACHAGPAAPRDGNDRIGKGIVQRHGDRAVCLHPEQGVGRSGDRARRQQHRVQQ